MQRFIRLLLLIVVSCIGMSCAHTDGPSGTVSKQDEVAVTSATPASTGVPSVEVPETSHDFGSVKETEGELVHEFKVKNVGAGVLQLKRVLPG